MNAMGAAGRMLGAARESWARIWPARLADAAFLAAAGICALPLHAATPVAPAAGGLQQSFTGDNVKATLFIPGDTLPRFGFVPLRIAIDNQQPRDLRWRFAFEFNSSTNYGATSVAQSVTNLNVPASRNGERWIFVPTAEGGATRAPGGYGGGWANFNVHADGTGIGDPRLHFNAGGRTNNPMVPWAVSASLESVVRTRIAGLKTEPPPAPPARPGYRSRPVASGPQPLLRSPPNLFAFDPTQSFGDWRIWSPFARVIVRADEYATMPGANRAALRNWVGLGGTLYIVPETTRSFERQTLGAGSIVMVGQPITASEAHDPHGLFTPDGIFNAGLAIPSDLSLQRGGLADRIPPAKRVGDWLVYFFVGFAVLVAPVNLFAIAPVRRRHWLFVSVPAISLAAVGILMAAIYLQDGVGGDGARRALVVLLPGDNQAAVFQEQVSRTGLLLGTSFPIAEDTICAVAPADDANFQPGRPLEYNRVDGRATGDWFRGRARQAQHLRRLTPTRARVERVGTAPDGAPIVQSSVGTTLREFVVTEANGATWTADQVAPGTRVTLRRAGDAHGVKRRVVEFGTVGSTHFAQLVERSASAIGGARFVALGGDSELAPLPTLASIRWVDSAVMFTGLVENATIAGKAAP